MSLSFFLARRFYHSAGHDRNRRASALAIRIATAGVAVGLVVMIVSICVVKGFQKEVRSKLSGFTAPMEVLDVHSFSSPESYPIRTDSALLKDISSLEGVVHVQRVSMKMGIFKTEDAFQTMILKGTGRDYDLAFLKSQMVEGKVPDFEKEKNAILISRRQADKLGLKTGSSVYAYFFSDNIRTRKFKVAGIYETHLAQFDDYFVWTALSTVNKLNGWDNEYSSAIEIYTPDYEKLDEVQAKVNKAVASRTDENGASYSTLSIKENPRTASVIQWLALLDFNVLVILALMAGVAGFTMISGLLILILERTQTIGVLKALGAGSSRIRHTFIIYAALIVMRGLFWGNLFGLGIVFAQQQWGWVRLNPASYYVDVAPVTVDVWWILGLNACTLCICVLALIVPSFVISRIQPAKAIRFE